MEKRWQLDVAHPKSKKSSGFHSHSNERYAAHVGDSIGAIIECRGSPLGRKGAVS